MRRIKAETPLAVTLEPRRARRGRAGRLARFPAPIATCCALRPPTARSTSDSTRRHPQAGTRAAPDRIALLGALRRIGLRGRQRRHDRHPRPELRRPGPRHGTLPHLGTRHDRRGALPGASPDSLGPIGRGLFRFRSPGEMGLSPLALRAACRLPARAGPRRRADDLQDDRAGATGVSAGEYSHYHRAGDARTRGAAGNWGWCGGPTSSCRT